MNAHTLLHVGTVLVICGGICSAQQQSSSRGQRRPSPTLENVAYGDHERQVLDLYQVDSENPVPLVVYIHGGGFRAGSKGGVPQGLVRGCHEEGIAVASINYRLTGTHSWPAQHHDGRRALQFLRHQAEEYGLDSHRIGLTGGSAGAGISLWLAFHEDMADPASDDPVARESTRVSAVACSGAQTSYDPHWIEKHIGGRAHLHSALPALFGIPVEKWDTPEALAIFKEIAAINHFSRDDPPVWLVYREPDETLKPDDRVGWGIHHPRFGHELKKLSDEFDVECTVKHSTDLGGKVNEWPREQIDQEMVRFFARHLNESPDVSRNAR